MKLYFCIYFFIFSGCFLDLTEPNIGPLKLKISNFAQIYIVTHDYSRRLPAPGIKS